MAGKRNQSRATSPASGSFSDDGGGGGSSTTTNNNNKEQDRFLPIANVSRIMKNSLPANAKISKEAKESVQECVSEFISFVTGEASDKCHREKRKTVNGDDLLWAMTTLGFDSYVAPLKVYLGKYRETEEDKVGSSAASDGCSQHQQQLESSVAIVSANNNYVSSGGDGRYLVGGDHHQQLHRYGAGDGGGGDRMMNGGPVFSERRPVYQGLDLQGGYDIGPAAVYTLGVGVHPHQATAVSAAGLLGYGDGGGRAMAHQFN